MSEHPRETLKRLEQQARKRFGQNFLVNPHAVKRIVRLSKAGPGQKVLEIGPGLGALTRELLATGCDLRAVELDRDLAAHLREELPEVTLVQGDAMKVTLDEMAPGDGWSVCANLPYNVSTRILRRLIVEPRFERLVLMFQKEVADRLSARPQTKAYGSLSVVIQAYAHPRVAIKLGPKDFHPKPKIDSAVVLFERRPVPLLNGCELAHFEKVVRGGFSHRRKTLVNALAGLWSKDVARQALESTVGLGRRAEELDVTSWGKLAAALPPAGSPGVREKMVR
ncbi:MAG: ribosomal RNA small subunit methyltransferase A [Proteobacteria bacterium]|nr:ribosomal RNA small subunit methyltransferase A [Pseudomonadota bacterium]MCP4921493.1 ribosomal RNA small subunit methyltransferase A [Pseudomonadota bacterium]